MQTVPLHFLEASASIVWLAGLREGVYLVHSPQKVARVTQGSHREPQATAETRPVVFSIAAG